MFVHAHHNTSVSDYKAAQRTHDCSEPGVLILPATAATAVVVLTRHGEVLGL